MLHVLDNNNIICSYSFFYEHQYGTLHHTSKYFKNEGDFRKSPGDKTWNVSEANEIGHWDSIIEIMVSALLVNHRCIL